MKNQEWEKIADTLSWKPFKGSKLIEQERFIEKVPLRGWFPKEIKGLHSVSGFLAIGKKFANEL